MASVVGLGLYAYFDTDRAYSRVVHQTALLQDLAGQLTDGTIVEVLHTRAYLITGDEQSLVSRALAHRHFERNTAALQTQLAGAPAAASAALNELQELHRDHDAISEQAIALRAAGRSDDAALVFDRESDPVVLRILETQRSLQDYIQNMTYDASWAHTRRASQTILTVALAFAFIVPVGSLLIARLLTPTVTALNAVERALASTVENPGQFQAALPPATREPQVALVKAYAALIERLRADEASRIELMTHITHDLRAPLAAIAGYAEVMVDPEFGPTGDETRKYLGIIIQQVGRMDHILEQMWTASQIEENQLTMMPAPLRLGALLEAEVAEASRQARREIVVDNGLPGAVVLGDALRLREVFAHLLDNSLKFSTPDSPVQAALRAGERQGWVEASISDQGNGIAAADMPRLFQRFGRLNNRNGNRAPGTGLGLFICRHIVERHGGEIDLISSPGEGTTARVRLPLAAPPA